MARAKRKAQPSADGDVAPEGDDDSRDWSVLVPILKQHLPGLEPRVALESCSHLHFAGPTVIA